MTELNSVKETSLIEGRMGKLEKEVSELKKEVNDGFNEINIKLERIASSIEKQGLEAQVRSDETYLKRNEDMSSALARLDDPAYRKKASGIIDEWMESEHGIYTMGNCFVKCMNNTRDNANKWLSFIKGAIGLIVAIAAFYGGNAIFENQKSIIKTQDAVLHKIEQAKR